MSIGQKTIAAVWQHRLSFGPHERAVTNRLIDGVLYFPMLNARTLLIVVSNSGSSYIVDEVATVTLAEDIKRCYFYESHLMNINISQSYIKRLNDVVASDQFMKLRRENDRWGMFKALCPKLRNFIVSSITGGVYHTENVIGLASKNILDLMLLLTVKSLNQTYNERYTLQKLISIVGGGGTGKSQLVNLFTLLSLNNSQSCEIRHLHGRFESFA